MTIQDIILIGAGFPRTGTSSTKKALEALFPGTRCHHMVEAFNNKEQICWSALARNGWKAERDNIRKILTKYQFTSDMPSMLWWKDIKQEFPQAKVILTVRDSFDVWYKSMTETVYYVDVVVHDVPWWGKPFFPQLTAQRYTADALFGRGGLFDGKFHDKEFARKVYENFIEDVKRSVPSDQLLVFNVKQGWEPLCEFLGVPCPDHPFPKVNESIVFTERIKRHVEMRQRRIIMIKRVAATVISAAVAVGMAGVRQRG